MSGELTVVADEGIAEAERFARHARLRLLPGRDITPKDLVDADALIVRSITRVDSKLLSGSPIRFVGSATIGIDHLDIAYLDQQQISWASAPGCNARAVVEYVLCALAAVDIPVAGRRFGIVGAGNVGGRLWRQLEQLGADCRLYDPLLRGREGPFTTLEDVLQCDVVTVHTPLTFAGRWPTANMIGREQLAAMPPGALLINAARGGVVDESALIAELETGRLQAVLDVWNGEPDIDRRLLESTRLATPHIAGYTLEGKRNGTRAVYRAFCARFGLEFAETVDSDVRPAQLLPAASMRELLLQVYDPRRDDRMLRQALESGEERAFDRLRREYPLRREFAGYCSGLLSSQSLDWGFAPPPSGADPGSSC